MFRNSGMVLTTFNFTLTIFVQALYFTYGKAHKVLGLGTVCFIHSPIQQIATEQLLRAKLVAGDAQTKQQGEAVLWCAVLVVQGCENSTRTRQAQ